MTMQNSHDDDPTLTILDGKTVCFGIKNDVTETEKQTNALIDCALRKT